LTATKSHSLLRIRVVLFLLRMHEKLFHPSFEDVFTKLFLRTKPEDMVIFDVGAHRGESIKAFNQLFCRAQIHAFEPDAENYSILCADWGEAGNVHLNNVGVGNENGEREFYHHLLTTTSTFKQINTDSDWVKLKSKLLDVSPMDLINKSSKIQVLKLDDYADTCSIEHISILKFDTEGFELECIEGCNEILTDKRADVIQIEGNDSDAYQQSTPYSRLVELIEGYGYTCYKEKRRFLNRNLVDAVFIREELLQV
jgi:FkbM family methyltransferase